MKLLISFLLLIMALPALGQTYDVHYRDIKLPSQNVIETLTLTTPIAATTTSIVNAQTNLASGTPVVTTFLTQPDVCRNVVITPGGSSAAGSVVVTGKNALGATITESESISANQVSATTGSKAFCSLSSVTLIDGGTSATYSVGVGTKLGLNHCMDSAGYYIQGSLNGAFEATRATIAANATNVDQNTASLNGTLDGTKNVILYYIQNFRCVN